MLLPVILADNHGVDKLPSSYGLMRLFQGCVTLVVPPLAGKCHLGFVRVLDCLV